MMQSRCQVICFISSYCDVKIASVSKLIHFKKWSKAGSDDMLEALVCVCVRKNRRPFNIQISSSSSDSDWRSGKCLLLRESWLWLLLFYLLIANLLSRAWKVFHSRGTQRGAKLFFHLASTLLGFAITQDVCTIRSSASQHYSVLWQCEL